MTTNNYPKAFKEGIHYLVGFKGSGRKYYEWLSKETGALRQWSGDFDVDEVFPNSRREFLHHFGDDLTVLPRDWRHL